MGEGRVVCEEVIVWMVGVCCLHDVTWKIHGFMLGVDWWRLNLWCS